MTHPNTQDQKARMRIVRTCKAILESAPSPELTAYIKSELGKATDPRFKGFLNLLITDNTANRQAALEAFRIIERDMQETAAREERPSTAAAPFGMPLIDNTIDELPPQSAAPATRTADIIDLTSVARTREVKFIPVHFATDDPEAEDMDIPATADPNGPRKKFTILGNETPAELLATQRPTSVAGLLMGVRGQKKVRHGFGIYLPLNSGQITLTDQPTRVRIAVGLPGAVHLYDDHTGPRLPGMSQFFAMVESMRDGYRFLVDLEIIPVNGRYLLSMKPQPFIDRVDPEGKPAMVNTVHLPKLHFAAEHLDFIGFMGEVQVS